MFAWGQTPWIAQQSISLTLQFHVGRSLCRIELDIAKGVVIQELCLRLFNEERIPEYLHVTLTDAVMRTLNEAMLSPVVHSEEILNIGLMIEQARLLSRQFDVTTTISRTLSRSFTSSFGPTDLSWALKPNTSFSNEPGQRPSSPPSRPTSPTPSAPSGRPSSPSFDEKEAQKFISSTFARNDRSAQQTSQLAKMYHFLVAGDHSVTPQVTQSESIGLKRTNSSLIDGDLDKTGSGMTPALQGQALQPTIVKLDASHGGAFPDMALPVKIERQYFRKKKQTGGSDLLLLQDTTNEFTDMLAELERSLATSMTQLIQAKDVAIVSLRERQAREMDRASQGGRVELIPQLVAKHLEEMEGLEAKWTVELAEARKRQRHEYFAFCSDLYKNRERYMEDKRAMGPQQVAKLRQQHAQMLAESWNANNPSSASSAQNRRFLTGGWTSLIFGRSLNNASNDAKVIRVSSSNSSLLMARESTNGENDTYSIVVMLGSQLKVPFEVQVYGGGGMLSPRLLGNVSTLTPTRSTLHPVAINSSPLNHLDTPSPSTDSIYSNNLSAIVLLVDPQLACTSPTYTEFFNLTSQSTELHFASAENQIDLIRSQVFDTQNENTQNPFSPVPIPASTQQRLQPGDFFITTHSNLGRVQVVFHMVGERQNVASSWTQLMAGLTNILTVASHYDITTLSLPILLIEPEFRHLYSDGRGVKRAEEVIRAMRSFLVLNSASGTSLKTIRLVCPPHPAGQSAAVTEDQKALDGQQFEKIKSLVSTLFNQPLH